MGGQSVVHSDNTVQLIDGDSDKIVLLHGDLDLWIIEAKSLPNMDIVSERMRRCFTVFGSCPSPFGRKKKRRNRHKIITSDPYVSVCLAGATVAQTRVIANSENPVWDEHFHVPVAHPIARLEFHVKDNDILGAQLIGVVLVSVKTVISGHTVDGWFPLVDPYGNPLKPCPELHLSLKYNSVEANLLYRSGCTGTENLGVPNTYFKLRKGCSVTLYQDAHVPDGMLPEIPLEGGKIYQHGKCWEDLCHAILEAHHLVYIIGWSVYHPVKLVREPTRSLPSGGELSLGELLKHKSQEGVREGVMQTHDEETRNYFKHSSVHCVLSPRYASNKLSIFKQQVVGTLFTHHQKCVLVDTQGPGNNRKITAYIGGLDLCDGRYDTPEHRLIHNLDSIFENDFHNPTFTTRSKGPRQPWHDLHCKVEGPAAYDIMTNFEQRWRKATKWRGFRLKKVTQWHDDTLIKLDRLSWMLTPSGPNDDSRVHVASEDDPENWHVQVFRSIDSGSVKGFPKAVQEAVAVNLVCGKNLKIDKSLHMAYVKAIRSAQHFIYIENQYFIGSSYNWPSYKNAGADNLVPMELALKIANKIQLKERFAVYVVIPMWPEGVPSSSAVQEVLFWQGQTIDMMYGIVAQALENAGLLDEYHPQDYLNFYCLGKQETAPLERLASSSQLDGSICQKITQRHHRFMIYVHAKGMIVDDEFVLMGSANINQRSLDGSRDTEIAMGSYQPNHTWCKKRRHPHGQVYGYRMSLWAEHLGILEDAFCEPDTLNCIRRVNELAKNNWNSYISNDVGQMKGHLLKYPICVERSGKVGTLVGHECFPDVGGKILGAHSSLPDALTT